MPRTLPSMMLAPSPAIIGVLVTIALGCGSPEPLTPCKSTDDAHAICKLQNPEDLVRIPGSPFLILSEFGSLESQKPGALTLLDTRNERLTPLFPQGGIGAEPVVEEGPDWGSARCPGPMNAAFSPHGIDLLRRADGKLALYAVNHGSRESVEIFEVRPSGESFDVAWRGCVPAQDKGFWNDVAALPDGGFVATHMFDETHGIGVLTSYTRAMLGGDTGYVVEWSPKSGLHKLPNTELPFPNGIAVSRDGREIFVNVYMQGEIRRIERSTGKVLATANVTRPDNLSWTDEGTLLVASQVADLMATGDCAKLTEGACPVAFEILEVDPTRMTTQRILRHEGAPMGAATSAVRVGDELFVGSFASDRLMRVTP
jgi:hypothetical protein